MVEGEHPRSEHAPARCRSCDAPLHGPYCSACGESHVYARLSLSVIAKDVRDALVNLDTRALRTVGELSVAPGKVCRDYIDGRRVAYVGPLAYAVTTVIFAFLVAELLLGLHGSPGGEVTARVEFELRWGPLLDFVAMPLIAGALVPLFSRAPRRLRWVEHYVIVLYTLGHVALLQGLLGPLIPYLSTPGAVLFGALPFAYLCAAAIYVYESRWWTTLLGVALALGVTQVLIGGVVWLIAPELLGG